MKLHNMVTKILPRFSIVTTVIILLVVTGSVLAIPPVGCIAPTTSNPGNDPKCNDSGTGTNCLSYCGASSPGFSSNRAGTGIAVIYYGGSSFSLSGSTINNQQVCSGSTCSGVVYDNNYQVAQGQSIGLTVKSSTLNGLGWRSPNSNGECGEAIPATDEELPEYGLTSIAPVRALVPSGYTIVSEQCWGDEPVGDSDFDFNDMMYIVAVRNPNPTSIPTATATISRLPDTSITTDNMNLIWVGLALISTGIGVYKLYTLVEEK